MATPITPDTIVHLLKCPLEVQNLHQINFANKTAQFNYFYNLPRRSFDKFSYQRHDGVIRINEHIDNLIEYNYVMYQNENYSDKWFYAFITGMEYVNDNCTFVSIKTDVFQTWWFDISFHKCFVEREHVNDDTVGEHTYPEGLDYGDEYECLYTDHIDYADEVNVVFQVTENDLGHGNTLPISTIGIHGGIPHGLYHFGFRLNQANATMLPFIVGAYNAAGKGDSIISIFLCPHDVVMWSTKKGTGQFADTNFEVPSDTWATGGPVTEFTIPRPNRLGGYYIPKNNKLYTAPYSYFYISNNAGSEISYAYENFEGTPTFQLSGVFSQGGSVALEPNNSKKSTHTQPSLSHVEAINGAKLPVLSWRNDYYLNWQAVNGKNVAVQTALAGINFGMNTFGTMMGGIMGNYGGMNAETAGYLNASSQAAGVVGLASDIASIAQQVRQAEMTPAQAKGNTNSGDYNYADHRCRFDYFNMGIKYEYAKVLDDYFTAVGYKINTFKEPNITGRRNWNYLKLHDANITGNIPQEDMDEIKGYFNRGITIWHNPSTYLDYSQDNSII